MKSRYGSAIGQTSAAAPAPALSAQQRLDAENAAQWATWAASVNERLEAFDAFYRCVIGAPGEGKEKDPGLLLELMRQAHDDTRAEVTETVKRISDALGARIEAEISVLHDEFVERLDATLLAHSPKKYRELVAEIGSLKDGYHKFAAGADT